FFNLKSKFKTSRRVKIITGIFVCLFLILSLPYLFIIAPPFSFDPPEIVRISSGMTISEAGFILKEKNIIKSERVFRVLSSLFGRETGIIAGDYYFASRQGLITVSRRMTNGDFGVRLIRVTIPEGLSARQMSTILDNQLPDF